jgi:glycosyltransferase involved in cell wall biosynthesis
MKIKPSPEALAEFAPSAKLDSVYFFMFSGWRNEMEANRWHWSKRWAEHLPVVLIQPELRVGKSFRAVPEKRLANVELLSIENQSQNTRYWLAIGTRQAGQIAAHMAARGHQRPLFWLYNPELAVPYALIPARARVFHATENHFDFDGLSDDWLDYNRYAVETSDLVLCCSSGVADGLARNTRRTDFSIVPNGCDFPKYHQPAAARGDWRTRLADWQQTDRRIAVFAGNINLRLDFELIETLVARYPELGFVFAGPAAHLSPAQERAWARLQQANNFRTLGRIPAEDLPALYHCCDVGIIPYRTDLPLIVDNGFPLKALEMAAAGLPVVSSYMKSLHEVAAAVTVVPDAEAFCVAIATHSRRMRSEVECKAAERICQAYDYDKLFGRMAQALAPRIGDGPCRPGDLRALAERIGLEQYREAVIQLAHIPFAEARIRLRYWIGAFVRIIPTEIKQRVPEAIRRLGRLWFRS